MVVLKSIALSKIDYSLILNNFRLILSKQSDKINNIYILSINIFINIYKYKYIKIQIKIYISIYMTNITYYAIY